MVVLLHNIRSLHNVGSIFRTADGAGVQKLYLCGITLSPLNRFGEVVGDIKKTALGAERTVAWEKASSTLETIAALKKEGFTIIALEQDPRATPYYSPSTINYSLPKLALVLGAEVDGLPAEILKKCDTIIDIPMHGEKESLNVAVAFGIVVYHLIQ